MAVNAFTKGSIPTTQYIEQLADQAEKGDYDALFELGELNNKIAKRANERMRTLERRGLAGTEAYNIAKDSIKNQSFNTNKKGYFSQSRTLDTKEAVQSLKDATAFLRSQTSTPLGEMERRRDIVDTLVERGHLEMPDEETDPAEFKRKFLEFLDTNAWNDIKKHMYATNAGMLKEAGEAIQNGAKLGDLTRAFKDYQKSTPPDTDLFEIWDNWTSGEQYYRKGQWHQLKQKRRK